MTLDLDDRERWIGRRIGAYEIVSLLGVGGMGEVYRARRVDAQYEKEVAVKLVPAAYAGSFILQRLRAEQQILAKLDHPHIARLIDAGATAEKLPYLIIELVEGQPLDKYCEQRKLTTRERLEIFLDVCSAVTYAHQRLIVHRDLKPNNILVSDDGVAKLLDFGIAKLLQPALAAVGSAPTVTMTTTATLEYASPEQILNKPLTTASDVYSLGVVLYLLLTGQLPYRNASSSSHDLMREVCEIEPVRPSLRASLRTSAKASARSERANSGHSGSSGGVQAIGERIDADLDAIILRALRKEPEKRYRSVEELAEDIRCYLRGLPVMARGDQLAYRATKFFRRHRVSLSFAAAMVALMVGGIILSLRQAHLANIQRQRAEQHFATVRKIAEVSMFDLHDAIKDLPGATAARQLLVNTALEYLNSLAGEANTDPSLQHDLASAYARVADIQGKAYNANVGNPAAAVSSYSKAIALLAPIVQANPTDVAARGELAQAYLQESRLLMLLGDSKKGVAHAEQAVALREALAAEHPDLATRTALADANRVLAMNLAFGGGRETATVHARKAIGILEDLRRGREDDLELQFQLGMAYDTAGSVLRQTGGREDAEAATELHLKALAIDEHLVALTGGRNATYARSLFADRVNLCSQLNDEGKVERAIEMCRAARSLLASLSSDTNNAQITVDATSLNWNLGAALLAARRFDEADSILTENVTALEQVAQQSDTLQVQYLLAASEQGLGVIQRRRAEAAGLDDAQKLRYWRAAKTWFERAVPRFEQVSKGVTLTYPDRAPLDAASEGLAKSTEQIAKLEAR